MTNDTELQDEDVFRALRKTWQPVCLERDLKQRRIISYTLLNEEIVIADLPGGLLAARDLCPHRGAKFGMGSIENGHLQCPYHGWEFNAQGQCARIPSLIDPSVSLEKSGLKRYDVQARYGMVWVRLDPEELAPLPDIPEYENTEWTYVVPDAMSFGTGFRREIDNYLDMSHFAFAHKNTLGVAARSQISDITITHFADGFQMDAPFPALQTAGVTPAKLQSSHHRQQRCFLPNFTTIRQSFLDGDERVLVHIPSPNTYTSCTVFWALAISPGFVGPPAEAQIEFAIRVLDEDRVMVENQRPLEVPIGAEESVMVPADRLANTYKGAIREFVRADRDGDRFQAQETYSERTTLHVIYGSQTGTAERLAHTAARTLQRAGFDAIATCLQNVSPDQLSGNVVIITSTYGNGNPPDNAREFYHALFENDDLDLSNVHFAVFALGDKTYPNFCQCGRDFDNRFEALGARRLLTRLDSDVSVDTPFASWIQDVQRTFRKGKQQDIVALLEDDLPAGRSASKPVLARVVENRLLSKIGSDKETRHYEVGINPDELDYLPGDALGIIPTNSLELVNAIITALGANPEALSKTGWTFRQTLLSQTELRRPSFALIHELARKSGSETLSGREELTQFAATHDVLDIVTQMPGVLTPDELIDLCDSLRPRLYSIASSPRCYPDSIHLTVSTVRYVHGNRTHSGAASTFLADRVHSETPVPVYLHVNPNFRLPDDASRDIIMIGPGTGIAPFRAFLQDREASGATGRNWLFFGDRRRNVDFLYEEDVMAWYKSGHLAELDLAFSRDQDEKIYVQHRMLARGRDLFDWLETGAYLYVCGESQRMAQDVDAAMHALVMQQMDVPLDTARDYVTRLQHEGRYRRDVY